jgi:hypothetical protein
MPTEREPAILQSLSLAPSSTGALEPISLIDVDACSGDFSTVVICLWETVGMRATPKLIRISETIYGCSECTDFKIEVMRLGVKSEAQLQQWREQEFSDHLKRRHSNPQ